jgi:hypothetical protein
VELVFHKDEQSAWQIINQGGEININDVNFQNLVHCIISNAWLDIFKEVIKLTKKDINEIIECCRQKKSV